MIKKVLWKGYPHLRGEGIKFNEEPFYDLFIGDKVTAIGDGRENGSYRTLRVTPFMMYVGSIHIGEFKYYAFLLPEQGVIGTTEPVYCLINDIGKSDEDGKCYCGRQNFEANNFYCYAAEFTKAPMVSAGELVALLWCDLVD